LRQAYVIDAENVLLHRKPDMIGQHYSHGQVKFRNKIWVFGGINESGSIKQSEEFDLISE
jgi:hypothetical protein